MARLLAIEQLLEGEPDQAGYSPVPAPRWWLLPEPAASRCSRPAGGLGGPGLRPVLRPLARTLAACWREHDLCLYVLDFVSELHSVLYLRRARSARTLADQAESI